MTFTSSINDLTSSSVGTNRAGRWRRRLVHLLAPGALVALALLSAADGAGAGPAGSVKASITKSTLTITGTKAADAITIRLQAGAPDILEVDVGADGTADFRFGRDRFTAVIVSGGAGNDTLVADPINGSFTDTEITTLNGEAGDDTLRGANGPERLTGGSGADYLDGRYGNDVLDGGGDDDTFQWDPGDANETVIGGTGVDRFAFNGASIGENINIAAIGGHARFARDIANVVVDLDQVETIDLRPLAGSDTITVGDLTGTAVTVVHPDLAASGGGDDLQPDRVVVPAGTTVSQSGAEATIDGLGAQVRAINGAASDSITVIGTAGSDVEHIAGTADADAVSAYAEGTDAIVSGATGAMYVRLTGVELTDVDLAGGNDQFSTSSGLAAVTGLDVDGGDGNDILGGSNGADVISGGAGDDFLDGWLGNDVLNGGSGNDTFQWDPGDANETIVGGDGADGVVFNGSNINENITVSATSGHARFTRDIANVVVDLDQVEAADLRPYGGADTITVGNLTGTALTLVRPDFAPAGGGDDLQPDRVVVAAGTTVSQDGAQATIDGLGAQVRVINGALTDSINVAGTAGFDVVHIVGTPNGDVINELPDGTDAIVAGTAAGMNVRLTGIELTDVDLAGGDDQFTTVNGLAAVTGLDVDGGDGNDTLRGSNGADVISGGAGDDFLDGWFGNDALDGGAGNDTFQWDPGDANETIIGGDGADRFAFNGAAANEMIGVSAAADHVRFTRDVANIVIDLDQVEAVDARLLGGTDAITIGDLTGTDLTLLRPDFAAAAGGDDLQVDRVVVPAAGTTISQDGVEATIDGLGAQVRVINGSVNDEIQIAGSGATDVAHIVGTVNGDVVTAFPSGTDAIVSGATAGMSLRLTGIELTDIDLAGGDDQFSGVNGLAAVTGLDVDGGDGNDTIVGSNGADVVSGGEGDDFLDGRFGNDALNGGGGNDTFQWDPGDANETIVGGEGADRLAFNGANIGETIAISATGSHARFTRDIANVALDLDQVEAIDLRTLGGSDTITVGDLTGTAVTAVRPDLALNGATDLQADTVIVNGTAGDDVIAVSDEGSAVVVQGLAATVRITGADPGIDRAVVNGLDGNDTITPTPGAAALILLDLMP